MRRLRAALAGVTLATLAVTMVDTGVASAECPSESAWGTGGLTPPRHYAVGVEVHAADTETPVVIYIDDRDWIGISARGDNAGSGGLWLYLESGAKRDLQRGGKHAAFAIVSPGGDVEALFTDDCIQAKPEHRDYILQ